MYISKVIFTTIGATLGTALVAGGLTVPMAQAKELKMATFMSPKHPINKGVLPPLAKAIAAETGGSLTLKLFPSGQLGKGPVAQYKRVIENVAEITFGIQGYTPTIFQRTMVVGQPGVGKSSQEVTGKIWNVYDKFLKPEYSKVKVLALFSNWPPVLITRKKAVSKMADIKGLKIRAPSPSNIPQLKAWGAAAVYMPVSKIYNALQTGVLDGVYNGIYTFFIQWKALPLLGGRYRLSVAVFDKGHLKPHVWHNQLHDFEVVADIDDHGMAVLDHAWGLITHLER